MARRLCVCACVCARVCVQHRPLTLNQLAALSEKYTVEQKLVRLVCGGTSVGVYPDAVQEAEVFVDISAVKELGGVTMTEEGLVVGATTTLSQLVAALLANVEASASFAVLAKHMKKVANWQVRSIRILCAVIVRVPLRTCALNSVPAVSAYVGRSATSVAGPATWSWHGSTPSRRTS